MDNEKKKSMWELADDYLQFSVEVENYPDDETAEKRLKIVENELLEKSERYVKLILHHQAEEKKIRDEIKRLQGLLPHHKSVQNRLKRSLLNAVKVFGPIKSTFYRVVKSSSHKLNIYDPGKIPPWYKKQAEPEFDKAKIKQDIKNGELIPGATIEENEHIIIR